MKRSKIPIGYKWHIHSDVHVNIIFFPVKAIKKCNALTTTITITANWVMVMGKVLVIVQSKNGEESERESEGGE